MFFGVEIMNIVVPTGALLAGGVGYQVWSGRRMVRGHDWKSKRIHGIVGYLILALLSFHALLGILDWLSLSIG